MPIAFFVLQRLVWEVKGIPCDSWMQSVDWQFHGNCDERRRGFQNKIITCVFNCLSGREGGGGGIYLLWITCIISYCCFCVCFSISVYVGYLCICTVQGESHTWSISLKCTCTFVRDKSTWTWSLFLSPPLFLSMFVWVWVLMFKKKMYLGLIAWVWDALYSSGVEISLHTRDRL